MKSYRVGMGQIAVEGGKPCENLDRAAAAVAEAARLGCRLIVLPECLDLGWTHPSARELAQPIPGQHLERLVGAGGERRQRRDQKSAGAIHSMARDVEENRHRCHAANGRIPPCWRR